VDRHLGAVVAHDRDDLEQLGVAGGADVEAGVVVLIVDRERMRRRVFDVLIGDRVRCAPTDGSPLSNCNTKPRIRRPCSAEAEGGRRK